MMTKFGVNSTRAQKNGPAVKQGERQEVITHLICPKCGARLERRCPSKDQCELAIKCPKCGEYL